MRARSLCCRCAGSLRSRRRAAESAWAGYLDYAYVYSSAEPDALARGSRSTARKRAPLEDYVTSRSADRRAAAPTPTRSCAARRSRACCSTSRRATRDQLDKSVDAIQRSRTSSGATRTATGTTTSSPTRARARPALDFVGELLDLWLNVIVPLETPYETLQTLSLSESPHSGFVAALPYLYENVARLILIRSQQMGITRGSIRSPRSCACSPTAASARTRT